MKRKSWIKLLVWVFLFQCLWHFDAARAEEQGASYESLPVVSDANTEALNSTNAAFGMASGDYILNNWYTKAYMGRASSSSAVAAQRQGKLASIRNNITWKITSRGSGYYTISCTVNAKTYYLRNASKTSMKVALVNTNAYTDQDLWFISGTSGRITIKNKDTGNYLGACVNIASGICVYSAASEKASWRFVKSLSYGTSGSNTYRELSSFSGSSISMHLGETKSVSLTKTPNVGNLLWATSSDFTYTVIEGKQCVLADGKTIKAKAIGNAKVKIVHIPTNMSITINVSVVSYDASLVAIYSEGRDRYSCLVSARKSLASAGMGDVRLKGGTDYSSSIDEITEMLKGSRLFVSRSHGYCDMKEVVSNGIKMISRSEGEAGIVLNADYLDENDPRNYPTIKYGAKELFDFSSGEVKVDLSNLKIAVFCACETARECYYKNTQSYNNLPNACIKCGAESAVGWTKKIGTTTANTWTNSLIKALAAGKTLKKAIYSADHNGYYVINVSNKLTTHIIFGNSETTLSGQ